MRSPICAAALAAGAAFLASCVGTGETPAPPMPPPVGPSSAEIKAELNALIDRSGTLIEEEDGRHYTFRPIGAPPRGGRSVFTAPPGYSVRAELAYRVGPYTYRSLDEYSNPRLEAYDILGENAEYEFAGSEGGISVAGASWDATNPAFRSTVVAVSLAAWMDHSFSLVNEKIGLDPLHDDISVYLDIFSIGAASGTNPSPLSGGATWKGYMLGIDEGAYSAVAASQFENAEPNVYEGAAAITLTRFTDPAINVRFSNITNTVRYLPDVNWHDLPLTEGGFEGRGIVGRFYGPAHEEVGGVFQFDEINGAFGALRE